MYVKLCFLNPKIFFTLAIMGFYIKLANKNLKPNCNYDYKYIAFYEKVTVNVNYVKTSNVRQHNAIIFNLL